MRTQPSVVHYCGQRCIRGHRDQPDWLKPGLLNLQTAGALSWIFSINMVLIFAMKFIQAKTFMMASPMRCSSKKLTNIQERVYYTIHHISCCSVSTILTTSTITMNEYACSMLR